MENKNNTFLKIIPALGLLLVLAGYYYVTVQIVNAKEELAEIEKSKVVAIKERDKAHQDMLLYQSKTKSLANVIQQTNDSEVIEKANTIINNATPVKKEVPFEVNSAKNESNIATAGEWELKGYKALFSKNVTEAVAAFKQSENAYNGFHMSYEIASYLTTNKEQLQDVKANAWKDAYAKIAKDFSWKMSKDIKQKLLEASKN